MGHWRWLSTASDHKPGVEDVYLLKNITPSGTGGSHVVRFTDGHFADADVSPSQDVFIEVDRSTTQGRSVVELIGCRGVSALDGNVTLKGGGSGSKAVFIVRDCDIADVVALINTGNSADYKKHGVDNWTFANGYERDSGDTPA